MAIFNVYKPLPGGRTFEALFVDFLRAADPDTVAVHPGGHTATITITDGPLAGTALTLSGEGLNETLTTGTIRSFTFSDDDGICADGLLPFQTSILDMIEAVLQGQGEVNYIGFEVLFELILPPLSGFGMIYTGSSDNDVCTGYITDDSFTCGEGNDLGQLSPGDDIFDMGPGFDTLDGSLCTQPVVLDGPLGSCNFGSNTCYFTGVEAFIGSDHGDILQAGGGIILLDGADGNDLITGSGPGGSSAAGGLAAGDETLIGGAGNDTIEARDGADLVQGGADDDSLEGGAGADTIEGGTGNDSAWGGAGADSLDGGNGGDWLHGEAGADTLAGGAGGDRLYGGAEDDVGEGGFGNDKLFGEEGADTLSGDGNEDTVDGGLGGDVLKGGDGDDVLRGGAGYGWDMVSGGAGSDRLIGGGGKDTLDGGAGDDKINGGGGADIFIFADGFGSDVLINFDADDAERIDLSAVSVITGFTDLVNNHLVDEGGTAVIVDGAGRVELRNVAFADVGVGLAYSAEDFIF